MRAQWKWAALGVLGTVFMLGIYSEVHLNNIVKREIAVVCVDDAAEAGNMFFCPCERVSVYSAPINIYELLLHCSGHNKTYWQYNCGPLGSGAGEQSRRLVRQWGETEIGGHLFVHDDEVRGRHQADSKSVPVVTPERSNHIRWLSGAKNNPLPQERFWKDERPLSDFEGSIRNRYAVLSFCNRGLSSFRAGFSLGGHGLGVVSGPTSVVQGPNNGDQRGERQKHRGDSRPEHSLCPYSHVLLCAQVVYFALFLPLTGYLVFLGYQVANGGLDALERGQKVIGYRRLLLGSLIALGSAGLLPGVGFWLAFEGGLLSFFG